MQDAVSPGMHSPLANAHSLRRFLSLRALSLYALASIVAMTLLASSARFFWLGEVVCNLRLFLAAASAAVMLLFFGGLANFVDPKAREVIQELISEEQQHMLQLFEMKKRL